MARPSGPAAWPPKNGLRSRRRRTRGHGSVLLLDVIIFACFYVGDLEQGERELAPFRKLGRPLALDRRVRSEPRGGRVLEYELRRADGSRAEHTHALPLPPGLPLSEVVRRPT